LDDPSRLPLVRVLEADPDLGAGIDPSEAELASVAAVAPAFELRRGPWSFFPRPERGALGALIVSGLVMIRLQAGRRGHVELLGDGDVISPWVRSDEELMIPSVVNAEALSMVRIALLDRRFALRAARWPEIQGALIHRLIDRSRRLSLQAAINSLPRIEERLEATLWALADRLGRVTPNGTVLTMPITHSLLAELIGAQRPSVSLALGRLQAAGTVLRTSRDTWILRGHMPEILLSLERQTGLQP
jgi:CRP-like cAMP-binding protein